MDDNTQQAVTELIGTRQDLALLRLQADPEYQELMQQQKKSRKKVDALYQRFTKQERLTIQSHYEDEMGKTILEQDAIYLQGLRDCAALFQYLRGYEVQI